MRKATGSMMGIGIKRDVKGPPHSVYFDYEYKAAKHKLKATSEYTIRRTDKYTKGIQTTSKERNKDNLNLIKRHKIH